MHWWREGLHFPHARRLKSAGLADRLHVGYAGKSRIGDAPEFLPGAPACMKAPLMAGGQEDRSGEKAVGLDPVSCEVDVPAGSWGERAAAVQGSRPGWGQKDEGPVGIQRCGAKRGYGVSKFTASQWSGFGLEPVGLQKPQELFPWQQVSVHLRRWDTEGFIQSWVGGGATRLEGKEKPPENEFRNN